MTIRAMFIEHWQVKPNPRWIFLRRNHSPRNAETKMSYDDKCFELAEHFAKQQVSELAQRIQDVIEDWLEDNPAAQKDS